MRDARKTTVAVPLRERIRCPHCWHLFAPEDTLWVSAHPDLRGDPCLSGDHQQRFLPSRFDVAGRALDIMGLPCRQLACPHCHLTIPRAALEMDSLFLSILGAPGSGKSYLLAAMTWALQRSLMNHFGLDIVDVDPDANTILTGYHATLFSNPQEDQLVNLPKTDTEGHLYESVTVGGRVLKCAKPFVFALQPNERHPNSEQSKQLSRTLCLYDNAGEHFLPGLESASSPVTQHLALARALLFLFDPTQHPEFRKACRGKSQDPQMEEQRWAHQQHQVLQEAAKRIRETTGLAQTEKHRRPLIVVVTKYDAWSTLIKGARLLSEWVVRQKDGHVAKLDVDKLRTLSATIRELLVRYAGEVVTAAEGFSNDVIYIPVSALGRGPEVDPASKMLCVRPRDISPMWAEVPMLYALHRSVPGLVLPVDSASNTARAARVRLAVPPDSATEIPVTQPHVSRDAAQHGDLKETGT